MTTKTSRRQGFNLPAGHIEAIEAQFSATVREAARVATLQALGKMPVQAGPHPEPMREILRDAR